MCKVCGCSWSLKPHIHIRHMRFGPKSRFEWAPEMTNLPLTLYTANTSGTNQQCLEDTRSPCALDEMKLQITPKPPAQTWPVISTPATSTDDPQTSLLMNDFVFLTYSRNFLVGPDSRCCVEKWLARGPQRRVQCCSSWWPSGCTSQSSATSPRSGTSGEPCTTTHRDRGTTERSPFPESRGKI